MGLTKSALFTADQNHLANLAKVLGHPARIAILHHLLKANQCVNNDLVQELGLAQPTISQHLKELKNIGVIQGTIEGASMCYCINPDGWGKIQSLFDGFFKAYQPDSCC